LKNELKKSVVQIDNLKIVNFKLLLDVDALKKKVLVLKSSNSPDSLSSHAPSLVSQILRETFDRAKSEYNILVYGVSDSSSSSVPQRISDDTIVLIGLLSTS
jgi:hypothetical protein